MVPERKNQVFFEESTLVLQQIEKIHDCIWGLAAGFWHLQEDMTIFKNRCGKLASENILKEHLIHGCDLYNASFKKCVAAFSWDDQKENCAWLLLVSLIALFEGWIEKMELYTIGNVKKKAFRCYKSANQRINQIKPPTTQHIQSSVQAAYSLNKKYNENKLDKMYVCYNYFKELRNSYIHNSSITTKRLIDAYNDYSKLTPSDLDVKELPKTISVDLNKKARISLRGVIGFSDILIRMIYTFDCLFINSLYAENVILTKIKNHPDFEKITYVEHEGVKGLKK